MKPTDYQHLREIFLGAHEREGDEREAWLLEACGDDEGLLAEVRRLLASEDEASQFLEKGDASLKIAKMVSGKIGPYTLREPLGEGGFAEVFLAEQEEPVRRRVALKLLKPGMDSREILARFEIERQALAMMQHSGIAKIFDADISETGRSWFAMEYVDGVSITDYCDAHRLGLRERIDLFLGVCEAIQHAHQKGVIHRDLKPSNILVGLAEGKPRTKVIDFGIAKATGGRLTEKTLFTARGMLMGTPAYMSPEQAEMSGVDIDTRSDVYSLGVLLYELLSGEPPFHPRRLSEAGYAEIQRIIREEEPPRPSTKSTTIEDIKKVASLRCLDENALRKRLNGDLDWIVMKALEKDRTRRYATVQELMTDIGHYLRNEPVDAGPPSARYRFAKFVQRNRVGVAAGSLVLLALAVGIATTTWQWQEARAAEREAVTERDRARKAEQDAATERDKAKEGQEEAAKQRDRAVAVTKFLTEDLLGAAEPSAEVGKGKDVLLREVMDASSPAIGRKFSDQPEAEAKIRHTLGETFEKLGQYDKAELHMRRALDLRRRTLGDDHPDTRLSITYLGVVFLRQGKFGEAEKFLREAVERSRRVLNELDHAALVSITSLGDLLQSQGQFVEAEKCHREALEARRRIRGNEDYRTLKSVGNLGLALQSQGKFVEAEPLYREALEGFRRVFGNDSSDEMIVLTNLANLFKLQGKLAEAEKLAREAVDGLRRVNGDEHSTTLIAISNLASLLKRQDKFDKAEPLYREALKGFRRVLGDEHPDTLISIYNTGSLVKAQGKFVEAEPYYREALAGFRRVFGKEHPHTLSALHLLSLLLKDQGKFIEAERLAAELLGLAPKNHRKYAQFRELLDAIIEARKKAGKQALKKTDKSP